MASVSLYPGAVTAALGSTQPTIVGNPPQWADASDATYATVRTVRSGGVSSQQLAGAPLDQFTGDTASVVDMTWHARVSLEASPSATLYRQEFSLYTLGGQYLISATWPEAQPFTTSPQWYTGKLDFADTWRSPSNIAAELAAGCMVTARALVPVGTFGVTVDFTVYEFRLDVVSEGAVQRQAPLRVVQRGNDGLGMSGGRRAVQSRTIQASNRVSGIR